MSDPNVLIAPRPNAPTRTRKRRRPVRKFVIVTHRWLSLALGLFLLVEVISGDVLLWAPELRHAANPAAYATSGLPSRVSSVDAVATVAAAHPAAEVTTAWAGSGVWLVTGKSRNWTVDQGTGRILGEVIEPVWIAVLENLHECAFTCEGQAGHVPAFNVEVPGTEFLNGGGDRQSIGGLALGGLGVLLLALTVGGIWLWFPRPARWRAAVTIRWRGGRFRRDTDLHKVAGALALLPLLLWGLTGVGFEFGAVEGLWNFVSPGRERVEPEAVTIARPRTGAVDGAEAIRIALTAVPDTTLAGYTPPAADAKSVDAAYELWLSTDHDSYALTDYPGDVEVSVSRSTGAASVLYGWPDQPFGQTVWAWSYPVHSGYAVGSWWRILWLVFGVVPVLLGVTGVSTWLLRHRTGRARRRAKAARDA